MTNETSQFLLQQHKTLTPKKLVNSRERCLKVTNNLNDWILETNQKNSNT